MKYLILLLEDIEKVDFSQIIEERENLRMSVDNSKFIIKWDGDDPTFILDLLETEGPYTREEILDIIKNPEWAKEEPEPINIFEFMTEEKDPNKTYSNNYIKTIDTP